MLRNYEEKDKTSVMDFHIRILNETGAYVPGHHDNDLNNIEETYINPGGCFVLIEENNILQAMGALKIISEKVAEIKRMRVETSLQRSGYGQKILNYLLLHAKNFGIEKILLDTSELQVAAQHFYMKNGFKEYNRKKWNDIVIIFYELYITN